MKLRVKILIVGCLIALSFLVKNLPWARESSGITQVMEHWGEQQSENSEAITEVLVSEVEGNIAPEHQVDGSNWSIPNILRHWIGGDGRVQSSNT